MNVLIVYDGYALSPGGSGCTLDKHSLAQFQLRVGPLEPKLWTAVGRVAGQELSFKLERPNGITIHHSVPEPRIADLYIDRRKYADRGRTAYPSLNQDNRYMSLLGRALVVWTK